MTYEVGLIGGGEIITLGPRDYVRSLFLAIENYVLIEPIYRRLDWSPVLSHLYMRPVEASEQDATLATLSRLLSLLDETSVASVDPLKLGLADGSSGIREAGPGLGSFYEPIVKAFAGCANSVQIAKVNDELEDYTIRLGRSSIPEAIVDKGRAPGEYGEADGEPLWLRNDLHYDIQPA